MHIDSDNHLSILEPSHGSELFKVIDESRENIGKWLSFPEKTKKVDDSVAFIERRMDSNRYLIQCLLS